MCIPVLQRQVTGRECFWGSEHNTCKGPVAEGSPALSRSKDGAGTARAAWGDFLIAKPGELGTQQEGLKEQGKESGLFSESHRELLMDFIREAATPGLNC